MSENTILLSNWRRVARPRTPARQGHEVTCTQHTQTHRPRRTSTRSGPMSAPSSRLVTRSGIGRRTTSATTSSVVIPEGSRGSRPGGACHSPARARSPRSGCRACTSRPSTAGVGCPTLTSACLDEELPTAGGTVPRPLGIGMHLAVNTLLASASEVQKRRYLPAPGERRGTVVSALLRARGRIWCRCAPGWCATATSG